MPWLLGLPTNDALLPADARQLNCVAIASADKAMASAPGYTPYAVLGGREVFAPIQTQKRKAESRKNLENRDERDLLLVTTRSKVWKSRKKENLKSRSTKDIS
jgi:hypothetical protein